MSIASCKKRVIYQPRSVPAEGRNLLIAGKGSNRIVRSLRHQRTEPSRKRPSMKARETFSQLSRQTEKGMKDHTTQRAFKLLYSKALSAGGDRRESGTELNRCRRRRTSVSSFFPRGTLGGSLYLSIKPSSRQAIDLCPS